MSDFLYILDNIGGICSTIIAVCAVLAIFKPIRTKAIRYFKRTNEIIQHNASQDTKLDEIMVTLEKIQEKIEASGRDIIELRDDIAKNADASICMLANRIINTYHKYKNEPCIESFEKDSLVDHFKAYERLGGIVRSATNGKIKMKFDELMSKPVK